MIVEHIVIYNNASLWRQDVYGLYIIILKFYDESFKYCVHVLFAIFRSRLDQNVYTESLQVLVETTQETKFFAVFRVFLRYFPVRCLMIQSTNRGN